MGLLTPATLSSSPSQLIWRNLEICDTTSITFAPKLFGTQEAIAEPVRAALFKDLNYRVNVFLPQGFECKQQQYWL